MIVTKPMIFKQRLGSYRGGNLFKIGVIPGDGVGPEVIAEGLAVLDDVAQLEGFDYTLDRFDLGGERFLATGEVLPDRGHRAAAWLRRDSAGSGWPPRGGARNPRKRHSAAAAVRFSPVHQPSARPTLSRRGDSDPGQGPRGHRHGGRPREQRGSLRGRGRLHSQGDRRGGGDPDLDQHEGRGRAVLCGSRSSRREPGPGRVRFEG